MQVKSALRAGQAPSESAPQGSGQDASSLGHHYMNKWYGGYHCHGKKDQYGNVSNATCRYIWPQNAQPPV